MNVVKNCKPDRAYEFLKANFVWKLYTKIPLLLGVETCFVKLQTRLYLTMSVNFIICRLSLNDIYYSYDLKVWFCVHFWLGFYFVCSSMKSKFC